MGVKTAIVTGASSGMGREFAKQLFAGYDRVYLIARREKGLYQTAQGEKSARICPMDVSDRRQVTAFFDALRREHISVDCLVCCAGFGLSGEAKDMDPARACDMIRVNFEALTFVTLQALPLMERGSGIIHVNSAAAFSPQPGFAIYAASKAGAHAFTRALRKELAPLGIRVISVCPGPVKTAFFLTAGPVTSPVKKLFMARPGRVAQKALKDLERGRGVSVYGPAMKVTRIFSGFLPEGVLVGLMDLMRTKEQETSCRKKL